MFRNSRKLYRRNCSYSGKPIISVYSPDKKFTVYDSEIWWGDQWDPLSYGQSFNFNEPFFSQFARLMAAVPRPALFNKGSENSTYTNHAVYNRNCYMCFNAGYCEDTYYSGDVAIRCQDCCDLTNVIAGELLYQCIDCIKCYGSSFLVRCSGCYDSRFLYDCRECHHCLFCANLRNKSFCISNKQFSSKDYFDRIAEIQFGSRQVLQQLRSQFRASIVEDAIHPAVVVEQADNICGNYVFYSRNIFESFDVHKCEDLRHCYDVWDIKDCMDVYQTMDRAEQQYETHASSGSVLAHFSNVSHENHSIQYTDHCFNSHDLFGCIGLKHHEYCILNKQYTVADYTKLVASIIEHMKATGEYGEFFPVTISPFGYNETVAFDTTPLSREDAVARGFNWCDYTDPQTPTTRRELNSSQVPDDIRDVTDDVLELPIRCSISGRLFRITGPELNLYRKLQVALPTTHPDLRYGERINSRDPRTFRQTVCNRCSATILTAAPDLEPYAVYCEHCYQEAVA